MRAPIFDKFTRVDLSSKRYAEPMYEFLNRSAAARIGLVRRLLEDYFFRFPAQHVPDLRGRLVCNDDLVFASAAFELIVHELLLRLGYSVEVHPEVPGTTRHPDFLAMYEERPLYLELVLITGQSTAALAAERRKNQVYDTINRLKSPDFFLSLEVEGAPSSPPAGKKLRAALTSWISSLSWEQERARDIKKKRQRPSFRWEHEGWSIVFSAVPKWEEIRGDSTIRPSAFRTESGVGGQEWLAVKSAIADKSTAYGKLNAPFLILVNAVGDGIEDLDIIQGLFGQEVYSVPLYGGEGRLERLPNGAWRSESGWQCTRATGAIFFQRLWPTNLGSAASELYEHPGAKFPLSGPIATLARRVVVDNKLSKVPGSTVAELLGLPKDWPELQEVESEA